MFGPIMIIERILLQKEEAKSGASKNALDKASILSASTKHIAARLLVLTNVIKRTKIKEHRGINVTRILNYASFYL